MSNHVHLIVVPESEQSLARTLGQTHVEYAQAVNQAERRSGHLWQNRFFSCPLDAAHLQSALLYVDLNPVRAGLAAVAWEWPWSSARAHSLAGTNDLVLDPAWGDAVILPPGSCAWEADWAKTNARYCEMQRWLGRRWAPMSSSRDWNARRATAPRVDAMAPT